MATTEGWPERLWIVRHAESVGNAARDAALAAGSDTIALPARDPDVPLSERGVAQAQALGRAFGRTLATAPPTAILVSPYRRTRETAARVAEAAGWPLYGALETGAPAKRDAPAGGGDDRPPIPIVIDERLREKDAGRLEGLTRAGIIARYPIEAEAYDRIGKFYYRPPGGESWCDVVLRLRSIVGAIRAEHAGGRVLIVAHQVIVVCLRYVLEGLDEERVLGLEKPGEVANTSVTSYRLDGERLHLEGFNSVAHLKEESAPVTAEPPASGPIEGATPGGGASEESGAGDPQPDPEAVRVAAQRVEPPASATGADASDQPGGDDNLQTGAGGGDGGPDTPEQDTAATTITPRLLARWPLPAPHADSDKNDRGQVLIVGGDARIPGGALLAGEAAFRVGAGKVQLAVAAPVAAAVGVALPEARVDGLPITASGVPDPDLPQAIEACCRTAAVVIVGPGLIEPEPAGATLRRVVEWLGDGLLVADAAALAGVTEELGRQLGGRLVLTPNAFEMSLLLDWSPERVAEDPEKAARVAAARFGATVALKGRRTIVTDPGGDLYENSAGNVGLAISGSGDVLVGIVGGLLARGVPPVQALAWATHLHGQAADQLAHTAGPLGYLPREIPAQLPALLAALCE